MTQLRVLVAIDETASFTLAAERLCLTQPAVSHAIRNLEEYFGVALFERRRDGVRPTDIGRAAVEEARIALRHVERMQRTVRNRTDLPGGQLRLGCFASAMNWILPAVISEFSRRLPGIEIEIKEIADQSTVEVVRQGGVDLGMVNLPCAGLDTYPLFEDDLLAVVAETEYAGRGSITVKELASRPFVLPRGACEPLFQAAFVSAGVQPQIAASATIQGPGIVLAMVRHGMGFTIMPALALATEAMHGLRVLRLKPGLLRRVAFAASSEQPLSPAAREFLAVMQATRGSLKLDSSTLLAPARSG